MVGEENRWFEVEVEERAEWKQERREGETESTMVARKAHAGLVVLGTEDSKGEGQGSVDERKAQRSATDFAGGRRRRISSSLHSFVRRASSGSGSGAGRCWCWRWCAGAVAGAGGASVGSGSGRAGLGLQRVRGKVFLLLFWGIALAQVPRTQVPRCVQLAAGRGAGAGADACAGAPKTLQQQNHEPTGTASTNVLFTYI